MLSDQARVGLERIFAHAAASTLALGANDSVVVEAVAGSVGAARLTEKPEESFIVLTIASYHFRLLTLFHLDVDPATRQYFSGGDPARPLAATLGELGNLCCGAMKRELGKYFPHTGMSTPDLLDGKCLAFLAELKPALVLGQRVVINASLVIRATLCLCAYVPIDFRVEASAALEETGMIELF